MKLLKNPLFPSLLTDRWMPEFFDNERFFDSDWMKSITVPSVNIRETEKEFFVELAAPGLNKKDFKIAVENGMLTVYAGPGISRVRLLQVYDRWGSLVFENRNFAPNDPSAGWDGSLGAQPFSSGVFVWYAELEGVDGRVLIFNGDVTVTR